MGSSFPIGVEPGIAQILTSVEKFHTSASTPESPILRGSRFRQFLDALAVAVYTTDANGRITFYNDAATRLWGRRPELGEEWCGSWKLFWPDGTPMPHSECPMAIALRDGCAVGGYQAVAERPDGSRVSFEPYPTPLRDTDGRMIGAVNVLVDVTERVRVEAALRASEAVKDEFMGLVSHELRTPVTTIFGNARLLRRAGAAMDVRQRDEMLADIAADATRLRDVVENLLWLTRLDGRGVALDQEPVLLRREVEHALTALRQTHPDRRLELTLHCPADVMIEADPTCLRLLMDNLLGNAHKYSPPESFIEVRVEADEADASVRILDRGIGMSEDDAERVFAPFYRSRAAKVHAAGVGVGLAVCKRIVDAGQGRIWAAARPGGGSEFGFEFPLLKA